MRHLKALFLILVLAGTIRADEANLAEVESTEVEEYDQTEVEDQVEDEPVFESDEEQATIESGEVDEAETEALLEEGSEAAGHVVKVSGHTDKWWYQLVITPKVSSVWLDVAGHSFSMVNVPSDTKKLNWQYKYTKGINLGGRATIRVPGVGSCSLTFRVGQSCHITSGGGGGSGGGSGGGGGGGGSGGGSSGGDDGRSRAKIGYATRYGKAAAGQIVCGKEFADIQYCGAPSDASGLVGPCSGGRGHCQDCLTGICNMPGCVGPSCGKKGCGRKVRIWCADSDDVCKTRKPIVMTINNVCPSSHPCNTCKKGMFGFNPCASPNHWDLCMPTFTAIAWPNKQPTRGIKIAYLPL